MQAQERLQLARGKENNGFLLLEVLISIVIIATALIVINRAFSVSLRTVRLAEDYILADCILEDKIFDIQIKEGFADTRVSDTVEAGEQEFFYTMEISSPDATDKDRDLDKLPLKKASLGINWGKAKDTSGIKVSTYAWEEKE